MTLSIKERINNGADWLDINGPEGWWNLVDLDTLDLDIPSLCVLGQVFAPDATRVGSLNGYRYCTGHAMHFPGGVGATDHGFLPAWLNEEGDSNPLTRAWRDLIQARQEAA